MIVRRTADAKKGPSRSQPVRLAAVALLIVLATLAGCAGKARDAAGATAATATTGVLRGVVVDDAIRPLSGANVTAHGNEGAWNATTGAEGTFRIAGLPPGAYVVTVTKAYHIGTEQAVDVRAGVDDPPLAKFQLNFQASSVPFASVYKYEGFHECGFNFVRVCSNINIATWIVLCQYGVCLGNVTADHSLFLQPVEAKPTFIQAELAWEATIDTGKALNFYIGGANGTELASGFATAYNFTGGESPLMLRITNHEGDSAWCRSHLDPPCGRETLNETLIGVERSLLGQVDAGPTQEIGGCGIVSPCSVGFSFQQRFTMYSIVFFGYEPPDSWRFTDTGAPPPAPAPPPA